MSRKKKEFRIIQLSWKLLYQWFGLKKLKYNTCLKPDGKCQYRLDMKPHFDRIKAISYGSPDGIPEYRIIMSTILPESKEHIGSVLEDAKTKFIEKLSEAVANGVHNNEFGWDVEHKYLLED